jgi:hypothetical protein
MNRAVLAIALPVVLSGCTTLYPPLYSAPAVVAAAPDEDAALVTRCEDKDKSDALRQTLACAEILQAVYSSGYQRSAQMQDISQLPIIGAAAAAAWVLLKDKENAARKAGKIGIATLTYSATRDQLLPTGLPDTFIKGHGALGCLIAEGDYFHGTAAGTAFDSLNASLLTVADVAAITAKIRYMEPSDPAAAPELLKAARTLAEQAITGANAQLRTSRQERAAKEFASSVFRKSVSEIAGWVASKGRARPNKSYDDLLKGMSSTPAPAPATEGVRNISDPDHSEIESLREFANDNPSPSSAELIRNLGSASQLLAARTIELQGNTPPYAARLKKVEECSTSLSTS